MSYTRTLAAIILLAICLLGDAGQASAPTVSAGPAVDSHNDSEPPAIAVWNETGADRQTPGILESVDWALARYDLAGLSLPDMEIRFHRGRTPCRGFLGLATVDETGNHRIDVCVGGTPKRRRILLHEFGHAWSHENLAPQTRDAFIDERGLDNWNDWEREWETRGTEHAAVLMAWGLNEHCDFHEMVTDEDARQLADHFELLTGTQPLCSSKVTGRSQPRLPEAGAVEHQRPNAHSSTILDLL